MHIKMLNKLELKMRVWNLEFNFWKKTFKIYAKNKKNNTIIKWLNKVIEIEIKNIKILNKLIIIM